MGPFFRRRLAACLLASASASLLACGSSAPRSQLPSQPAASGSGSAAAAAAPSQLGSVLVTSVADNTLGPYVAYSPDSALALFAPPNEKGRRWLAQPLRSDGHPIGSPIDVAPAPEDAPFAVLRPISTSKAAYVGLWVRSGTYKNTLEAVLMDRAGLPQSKLIALASTNADIIWVEAVQVPGGCLVFYAERNGNQASVSATFLGGNGEPQPRSAPLTRSALAWQVIDTPTGAALATVQAVPNVPNLGRVVLQLVDRSSRPSGGEQVISNVASAQPDIDLIHLGGGLMLSWTDRREVDSRVFAATTDLQGKVRTEPHALIPPRGEQALLALVGPGLGQEKALLAYEELPQESQNARTAHLVSVDNAGHLAEAAQLQFATEGREALDFVASPDGFIALTQAPACAKAPCAGTASVPWYVRLSPELSVLGSGPFLLDKLGGKAPQSVWAPGCSQNQCLAFAVGSQVPAAVLAVPLTRQQMAFAPPVRAEERPTAPYMLSNRVVYASNTPLSEIAVTPVGDKTMLGWITHFDEPTAAPKKTYGATRPAEAHLAVRLLDASGALVDEPNEISMRAMTVGGVALASSPQRDACVAWVARDAGDPQVFLTRLGEDNKRKAQKMITRTKGDAADVAIAWGKDSWIVAWVDWRDGNGEVYLAKVDAQLRTASKEVRLTKAPGDASDVSLLVQGDSVLVAYADARNHTDTSVAEPYLQRVSLSDLKPQGSEIQLAKLTDTSTRTVRFGVTGERVAVGWIEEPLAQAQSGEAPSTVRLVELDPQSAQPLRAPMSLSPRAKGAHATGLALECTGPTCHGVLSVDAGDALHLEAFMGTGKANATLHKDLGQLSGPPGSEASPWLVKGTLYVLDHNPSGESLIRRAQLQW